MMSNTVKSTALFWRGLFRHPTKVGSICPSSRFLANKMAALLPLKIDTLVEVGAGTGAITRKLDKTDHQQLVIFERESHFCAYLQQQYPLAEIVNDSIEQLNQYQQDQQWPPINAIASSLPLLNFNKSLRMQILTQLLAIMPVGGTLVQFTYGRENPAIDMPVQWHDAVKTSTHKVWLNVPPATVWRYQKRQDFS